jgi:hypothetical protein
MVVWGQATSVAVSGTQANVTITWRNAAGGGGAVIGTSTNQFKLLGNTVDLKAVQDWIAEQGTLVDNAYARSQVIATYLATITGSWTQFP